MDKAIIGKKLGMSQIFTADGKVIPVTVVEAGPCTVVQIKTKENDGYDAVQVGFGAIKETRVNKPVAGHFKKAGVTVKKYLRELRFANCAAYELGQELTCDVFAEGDKVDVTGTSKGHGYSGVIQRWNSHRIGPMSHGTGPIHRSVGSMGPECSRTSTWRDSGVTRRSRCRTSPSLASTRRGICCSSRALSPDPRAAWSSSSNPSRAERR